VFLASAASLVPFTAYGGIRAAAIGEFGVTSFAGYNLIGITSQFLIEDDLPRLSQPSRELAEEILRRRPAIDGYGPPSDYPTMVFLYNATVWRIASPASETLYGADTARCNQQLQTLAWECMALHPVDYLDWMIRNGKSLFDQILQGAIAELGSRIALLALLGVATARVIFPQRGSIHDVELHPQSLANAPLGPRLEFRVLLWICIAFATAKGLLVLLVEPALGRYVVAMGCLLPSLIGWICCELATLAWSE
jgi:hypothetical protein